MKILKVKYSLIPFMDPLLGTGKHDFFCTLVENDNLCLYTFCISPALMRNVISLQKLNVYYISYQVVQFFLIWDCHSGSYEDCSVVGFNSMQYDESQDIRNKHEADILLDLLF